MELESKHALLTSIWRFSPVSGKKNPHPAPFPVTLPTRIIASMLNENDGIVLDPYCGSGTTLLAAKLLHKKFIGIDISEEYIKFSAQRLQNASSEKIAVEEEIQKHIVQKTFKQRKENGEFTGKHRITSNYKIFEEQEKAANQLQLLEEQTKYAAIHNKRPRPV